jgi:hypothetical protein
VARLDRDGPIVDTEGGKVILAAPGNSVIAFVDPGPPAVRVFDRLEVEYLE